MSSHRNISMLVLSVALAFGAGFSCTSKSSGEAGSEKAKPPSPKPEAANPAKPEAAIPATNAATATAPSNPTNDQVVITLKRGICYGTCPIYTVTIQGDGTVLYKGEDYVRVKGEQRGTARLEDVARLVDMFERAHFFDLSDRYRATMTDMPTYYVTYSRNGRTKTVEDYVGEDAGMPKAVSDIEDEIDRVAHTEQWVRIPSSKKPVRH